MQKRHLHLIQLTDPDHDHEEVLRLYNTRDSEVSVMHPIELYVTREILILTIESNLEALHRNRGDREHESRDDVAYIEAMIQQRVDFLERLRSDHNDSVFVAIYPASSDEDPLRLDDDEDGVSELLSDDDLPM